jgi:flagellar biosynthesis protein FlhF
MADVRTFRAATMREALDRVRAELGAEAVILSTRQVPVRRIVPWKQREEVEITAGLGIVTKASAARAARKPPRAPALPHLTAQERRAAEIVQELKRRNLDGPLRAALATAGAIEPPEPDEVSLSPASRIASHAVPPSPRLESASVPASQFSQRLEAIEQVLLELAERQRNPDRVPAELQGAYDLLLASDVREPLARAFVERLHECAAPAQLADPAVWRKLLTRLVESSLRCRDPITILPGVPKTIAFVGPTGVGKTTTLAKLAASFRLRDRLRTGLITADLYRIAATDQLRRYAEILGLPMRIVTSPAEMRGALAELAELDVVLIDTGGRSPRDAAKIAELRGLLAAAAPDETHLVLSLTAGRNALAHALEAFRPAAPAAVIVTKIDESKGVGPILDLCNDGGLPISYLSSGQEVPDDIRPARAGEIARWITNDTGDIDDPLDSKTPSADGSPTSAAE